MIAICEECGKRYRIDPSKIKGEKARFKCRSCGHVITVSKPEAEPVAPPPPPPPITEPAAEVRVERPPTPEPEKEEKPARIKALKMPGLKLKRLGLRGKMLILFFFVPIILVIVASLVYLRQLDSLSHFITKEGSKLITQMAEKAIAENARSVALQAGLFLLNHPDLKREDFNNDVDLKRVAVQKVGLTGYTALYELPSPDGIWRTWAHVNPKIIAIDMSKLKKPLGKAFPGFWRVYIGVKGGKESRGYYTWQDKDGRFREKFMVCTPIEGTPYIIASTTYLDEFTMPMERLGKWAKKMTADTRKIILGILGGTLILIGVIVFLYGHRLSGKIKSLSSLAERISVGELDAEVEIKSKDEIGDLGEAISRMQDSIRLSIERLRRRR